LIKTVDFFSTQVSRLIIGDNPFNGHSYIKDIHSGAEMMDYYTAEKCVEALFEAEANGINTYFALANQFVFRIIRQYRNQGGKMHIIFQSYPPVPLDINIREMLECEPIAIFHQGGTFDLLVEEGKIEEIHTRLNMIKNSGVIAGLATHVPEVILRAEKENWPVDFYAACLYNARRQQRGQQSGFITGNSKDVLIFFPGDPPLMCEVVKGVSKPCILYKAFAGGQIFINKKEEDYPVIIEEAFMSIYSNIKQTDMLCIGVFQKKKNQIAENCNIAKKVLEMNNKTN